MGRFGLTYDPPMDSYKESSLSCGLAGAPGSASCYFDEVKDWIG